MLVIVTQFYAVKTVNENDVKYRNSRRMNLRSAFVFEKLSPVFDILT